MRVTITVTLNGTNVNPYNKLWGLKPAPRPAGTSLPRGGGRNRTAWFGLVTLLR